MRRRKGAIAAAVAAGILAVGGTAWAISATLTVSSSETGTNASISGCDTAWAVTFGSPTYDETLGQYAFTTVSYTGVAAACGNKTIVFTIADDTLAAVANATGTVPVSGSGASVGATLTLNTPVPSSQAYTIATAIYS
ncbi:MAG: hypothetical protein ACO28P_10715 [Ilumatobacteraceae bacterium]